MMMRYLRVFVLNVCLTIGFLGICDIASADIAIAPLTRTIQVAPGKRETLIYRVANRGDKPVTIDIGAKTWSSLPENAGIDIGEWLKIEPNQIELLSQEEKQLEFKVDVPKKAKGELAGMIYFTPKRGERETIGSSYGVSLYVFVKGTEIVQPEISGVSINRGNGKYYLAVRIANKGNVHFRPKVKASLRADGDFKEDVTLPFGKPIFGGKEFTFVSEIKNAPPQKGICTVDVQCNYANSEDTVIGRSIRLKLEDVK